MTKDEALMAKWERLLAEGIEPNIAFDTNDIEELIDCFRDVVIVKALRRNRYNLSATARDLNYKSRDAVRRAACKYIPNYKELKHLESVMR